MLEICGEKFRNYKRKWKSWKLEGGNLGWTNNEKYYNDGVRTVIKAP